MTLEEKIAVLEGIMDVEEGTINENTVLADLDEWDSITRLSLMIHFDEEYGKQISGEEIIEFKTIKDIIELM